jgi:hypothetical protein
MEAGSIRVLFDFKFILPLPVELHRSCPDAKCVKKTVINSFRLKKGNGDLKGIFQPFELGGVTRLIRSAVKFW